MTGPITKYLGNMQQGTKNSQNTKVDKNLVKAKKATIGNLMNQIGEDDDEDEKDNYKYNNRNNNNNFSNNKNYNINTEYVPQYSKRQLENKNNYLDDPFFTMVYA